MAAKLPRKRSASEAGLKPSPQLANGLCEMLECPVCYEDMCAPIYQCPGGHLICSSCKLKVPSCPTCRSSLSSEIRNRALEKLAETLSAPCQYGCGEVLPRPEKKEHEEKKCLLRPFACPSVGSDCDFKGTPEQIAQHMCSKCEAAFVAGPTIPLLSVSDTKRSGLIRA